METSATPILWPLIAGAVIILANAFFVIFEFAIVTVRRGQIERLAEAGNRNAGLVSRMLRRSRLGHRRVAGRHHDGFDSARRGGRRAAAPAAFAHPGTTVRPGAVPRAPLHGPGDGAGVPAAVVCPDGDRRADPENNRPALPGAKPAGRGAPHDDLRTHRHAAGLAGGSIDGAGAEAVGGRRTNRRSRHSFA